MINFNPFKMTVILGFFLLTFNAVGQIARQQAAHEALRKEADRQIDDYMNLVQMGYSEKEIFEDLGNVNFLTGKFRTASFWYQKLVDLVGEDAISLSYKERLMVAQHKAGIRNFPELDTERDWHSRVAQDYQIQKGPVGDQLTQTLADQYEVPEFLSTGEVAKSDALTRLQSYAIPREAEGIAGRSNLPYAYNPPVAMSADGKTAYFSRAVYVKPLTGLFSKKQLQHKVYRAEYSEGTWTNIQEIPLAPKYASAMHPTLSRDGKRLFFASDMPGSYGEFDIYVADISRDGSLGVARNLGEKVNTAKNDLYPQILDNEMLFFASEGHKGYGGLDLFAVQVASRKVGLAVNVGSPFNSRKDDFAMNLMKEKGRALVMSNRATTDQVVQQVVFTYGNPEKSRLADNGDYRFLELRPLEVPTGYTNTVFEEYED
ncbi:TolB family protein [Robiginitalea aurantiaca]|uniref:Cell envelope biogenesis protein OmpA n=1 Tax=Robiginitalea aurantiaca TaxID=3056915 RepID=A0ABT7WGW4_9FLAO|nr:cell envelope biogenesis protein OmpA [Robiginitalea aurantiaca]MDM9632159.1 cell envelope biogenesis protein OmpA [Robiginitalea aurantiaca]